MSRAALRRCFRFSLRTLLVAMAVACLWLGRQVNLVHERRALLASLAIVADARFDPRRTVFIPGGVVEFAGDLERPGVSIPWYRKLLGDETVTVLALRTQMSRDQRERFHRAFPETAITYEPPGEPFVTQRSK
jgi:hypothetical protein